MDTKDAPPLPPGPFLLNDGKVTKRMETFKGSSILAPAAPSREFQALHHYFIKALEPYELGVQREVKGEDVTLAGLYNQVLTHTFGIQGKWGACHKGTRTYRHTYEIEERTSGPIEELSWRGAYYWKLTLMDAMMINLYETQFFLVRAEQNLKATNLEEVMLRIFGEGNVPPIMTNVRLIVAILLEEWTRANKRGQKGALISVEGRPELNNLQVNYVLEPDEDEHKEGDPKRVPVFRGDSSQFQSGG
ncbi:MAG: hypothetical protein Q9218_003744 [Villophora microphyllina]